MTVYDKERRLIELNFDKLLRGSSKFRYLCLIPQHTTENVLEDILLQAGVKVYYGKKVIYLNEVPGGTEVVFEGGEMTTTPYIVGADGSGSTVNRC